MTKAQLVQLARWTLSGRADPLWPTVDVSQAILRLLAPKKKHK